MVLKEWKKSKVDDMSWNKKDDKFSFVIVWKIGLPSFERKRRGIGAYGFRGRIGRNGVLTKKNFKTKSQALKSARSYMRTH